jgi:hypothetical protein
MSEGGTQTGGRPLLNMTAMRIRRGAESADLPPSAEGAEKIRERYAKLFALVHMRYELMFDGLGEEFLNAKIATVYAEPDARTLETIYTTVNMNAGVARHCADHLRETRPDALQREMVYMQAELDAFAARFPSPLRTSRTDVPHDEPEPPVKKARKRARILDIPKDEPSVSAPELPAIAAHDS